MRACRGGDTFNLTEFGLSESGLHRLIHLHIWSPSCWNYMGRNRKCDFAGGSVSLGAGFEVWKDVSLLFLSLTLVVNQDMSSQLFLCSAAMDSNPLNP